MMKVFSGSSREEFKEWNEKLVNHFSVTYDKSRLFFKNLMKYLNTERIMADTDQINKLNVHESTIPIGPEDLIYMGEDLYFIQ